MKVRDKIHAVAMLASVIDQVRSVMSGPGERVLLTMVDASNAYPETDIAKAIYRVYNMFITFSDCDDECCQVISKLLAELNVSLPAD